MGVNTDGSYAAIAVFADYFLQLTLFVAVMSIDARRQAVPSYPFFFLLSLQRRSRSHLWWLAVGVPPRVPALYDVSAAAQGAAGQLGRWLLCDRG